MDQTGALPLSEGQVAQVHGAAQSQTMIMSQPFPILITSHPDLQHTGVREDPDETLRERKLCITKRQQSDQHTAAGERGQLE